MVAGALKGAIFAANIYENLGFPVVPDGTESRHDIIQAVTFGTPEGVIAFCQGIQAAAPVDSFVTPEPWDMPGYDAPVIMAAGAFVQGSSIELSADGPIKPLRGVLPGRAHLVPRKARSFDVLAETRRTRAYGYKKLRVENLYMRKKLCYNKLN